MILPNILIQEMYAKYLDRLSLICYLLDSIKNHINEKFILDKIFISQSIENDSNWLT